LSKASELWRALTAGDRRALAKAITQLESSLAEDREAARELLSYLGNPVSRSFRIGVTGVPGAGKSTLIDALGCQAIAAGRRVAVLAIDPSSRQSGGSVLGDKTRMTRLSSELSAFVRPSPTLGVLGGTAGRTREVIALCEAAGYDTVFVETVGVGQSEEHVASMVDCVLLVLLAGAGDELSSMKRGVLEVADLIVINKADGGREQLAQSEAASLRASLSISRGAFVPLVLATSAEDPRAMAGLWSALVSYQATAEQDGSFVVRRTHQRLAWFEAAFEAGLRAALERPDLARLRAAAALRAENGSSLPWEAAEQLVAELLRESAR